MRAIRIAVLPGDGIGKEVTPEGVKVLQRVEQLGLGRFEFIEAAVGGAGIDFDGDPLPEVTLEACRRSDAILLGAVGDPKHEGLPRERRPERALLDLRAEFQTFANLRPACTFDALIDKSPLKPEVARGVDVMMVRELTGGLYYGEPRGLRERHGEVEAFNTMVYRKSEIERVARIAFDIARQRRRRLASVDKANALEVSEFWRDTIIEVSRDYPDVELRHFYVDNCAMALATQPGSFDVILTENTFGDILSDEAAVLTGSLGVLPSASVGGSVDLYEPVHGSAPDIAGLGIANPIAAILSAAMLLRHCAGLNDAAHGVEVAVCAVLAQGYRTQDLAIQESLILSTSEMGDRIADELECSLQSSCWQV